MLRAQSESGGAIALNFKSKSALSKLKEPISCMRENSRRTRTRSSLAESSICNRRRRRGGSCRAGADGVHVGQSDGSRAERGTFGRGPHRGRKSAQNGGASSAAQGCRRRLIWAWGIVQDSNQARARPMCLSRTLAGKACCREHSRGCIGGFMRVHLAVASPIRACMALRSCRRFLLRATSYPRRRT